MTLVAMENSGHAWAGTIAAEAMKAATFSVGLLAGNRVGNDRRAIDQLVKSLAASVAEQSLGGATLLVRLMPGDIRTAPAPQSNLVPTPEKSPLGNWYEFAVPVPSGTAAPWTVEKLPHWLRQWRQHHRVVMLDLGPMHSVASRVVARLCDVSYILLGPATCASHDWIVQQMAMHQRSGTVLVGSLVANIKSNTRTSSAA